MLAVYINFKGNAREAIALYEKVFETKCHELKTFGDMPDNPNAPIPDDIKDQIMHAAMTIEGTNIMISDTPDMAGVDVVTGNNISLIINRPDGKNFEEMFDLLAEEGTVTMPLEKTFWAVKYGSLIDKFGINWVFNQE